MKAPVIDVSPHSPKPIDHMKTTTAGRWLALLILSLIFAACEKPPATSESAPEPESRPAPPAVAANLSAASASAATPAPATPAPELAPPGVFFLIAPASLETSEGILGLKPGQQLKLVRPGTYSADGHEIALREDQVTNDMGFARAVAAEDSRTQAAIRSRLAGPATRAGATASANSSQPAPAPATANVPPPPTRAPLTGTSLDSNATHDKTIDHKRWHKTVYGGWIYN